MVYLVIFLGVAIGFWIGGRSKIAVVFMVLWLMGFYGFEMLHLSRDAFRVYVAALAAVLLFIDR